MVRDLSRQGARIEIAGLLAVGQRIKLEAQHLPTLIGNICWRSTPAYGVVFQQMFAFEELALLAAKLQAPGTAAKTDNEPRREA
jgi:hypothetical protein